MCCSGAKWKRENVPDHKFDFIDVKDFREKGCFTRLQYIWIYVLVVKSFLVYASDIYTAVVLLASNKWSGQLLEDAGDSKTIRVPFNIGKWIFTGCIIMSFLLLAWEARKARNIIRSRDISYAFTNVMANNYYSMKSYDYFCFFSQINNSKKTKDDLAFFVFFTFKGWKRLLLADAPRQVINALTLYSFGKAYNFTTDVSVYVDGSFIRAGILITMIFTVVVWLGSAVLLLIAAIAYVPLLCYIQGNLKEYCCHKIDKRIAELMKKKTRKRLAMEAARARKEAAGDFSHLKDKNGKLKERPMAQPTLPKVNLDDDYKSYNNHGGSDLSLAKDAKYYNDPSHAYPPVGYVGYDMSTAPQPAYAYASSEVGGYASSVHSTDKLMHTPSPYEHDNYSPYPLGKAPSYRSQTSLNDTKSQKPWDNYEQPPLPTSSPYYTPQQDPNPYFAEHPRSRSPGNELQNAAATQAQLSQSTQSYADPRYESQQYRDSVYETEYEPISRKQLYEQTSHGREASAGANSAYGGMASTSPEILSSSRSQPAPARRRSSAYDLGDYYGEDDQPYQQNQQSQTWNSRR